MNNGNRLIGAESAGVVMVSSTVDFKSLTGADEECECGTDECRG
jgi:hypothetical protein